MIITKAPTRAQKVQLDSAITSAHVVLHNSTFKVVAMVEERILIGFIRSPMFITIPYVAKTMIGYKVAYIPAIMGSFDPCIGETDR